MNTRTVSHLLQRIATESIRGVYHLCKRQFNGGCLPEYLWFEATERCNSRCIHCNIWRRKPSHPPLSPHEIERCLHDPIFRDLKVVVISGGEPTLRKDLIEIIQRIHSATPSAAIVLSTNGILPQRVIAAASVAVTNGIPIDIGISLNGIGKIHDTTRGIDGLYKRVVSLIHRLRSIRQQYGALLGITIGFTISNETISAISAVKTYADSLDISFNPQWFMNSEYYDNQSIDSLSDRNGISATIRKMPPTIINDLALKQLSGKPPRFSCFSLYNFCILKSSGDISPCFSFWNNDIGNIRTASPTDIWSSKKASEMRKIIRRCPGCLSTCAIQWSFEASFFPRVLFNCRHPGNLLKKLSGR